MPYRKASRLYVVPGGRLETVVAHGPRPRSQREKNARYRRTGVFPGRLNIPPFITTAPTAPIRNGGDDDLCQNECTFPNEEMAMPWEEEPLENVEGEQEWMDEWLALRQYHYRFKLSIVFRMVYRAFH
jgi:hypothetical protein